ncbi:MAG: bifunctional ADP-dependent NAD(P)H-hydrate dehydratase/NAD(P)H-hydrate epimerase, partial [Ancrocorticia sp.]
RSDDIRQAEEPLLERGEPLMDKAAGALATETLRRVRAGGNRVPGTVVLGLVGTGNNGGDVLYSLARLARRGMSACAILAGRPHSGGFAAAQRAGVRFPDVGQLRTLAERADVWIDGLVGIGARGPLRDPALEIVRELEDVRAGMPAEPLVIAADVPSGIGADDGVVAGLALHANVTVTMGAVKPGLVLDPGRRYAGEIVQVPLGLEEFLPSEPALLSVAGTDIADMWDVPGPDSHKYTRGVVGVMTGSVRFPGAALLSTSAALGGGAGMVRYAGPREVARLVVSHHPEVVTDLGRVQAWVLGSGVDMDVPEAASEVARRLQEAVTEGIPVVLDAGAIALLGTLDVPSTVVITPHAGELAELLAARGEAMSREEIVAAPSKAARLAATLTGATVLLKGSVDVACAPDDPLWAQGGAAGWRATAGAGDVLAGLLGSVLAQWGDELADLGKGHGIPARLAAAASYIHGRAAAIAYGSGQPIVASQIASAIPQAIGEALAHR